MIARHCRHFAAAARINSQDGHIGRDTPSERSISIGSRIVSSYVRTPPDRARLPALIAQVHQALTGLRRAAPAQNLPAPAVSIRRSVHQDYVVCLECGYAGQMLRRHLRVAHGLEAADYRTRWKLPPDHPLTAPGYSAALDDGQGDRSRAPHQRKSLAQMN